MLLSRRQTIAAGGAALFTGASAWYGRYAFGDTFENHVARVLGLDARLAAELVASLRERTDDYEARAAGFLLASKSPARDVMPEAVRKEALEAFIGPLVGIEFGLITPLAVAGRTRSGRFSPCVLRR